MKKIHYLIMSLVFSLIATNAHAMVVKTYKRIRPQENIHNLLRQRNGADYAIIMLKKVQASTSNKEGDIYPLDNWNWYLSLKGDTEALPLHSFSRRSVMLKEQEVSRNRIDDAIKSVVNPYGTTEKDEEIDVLLQKSSVVREEYMENDVINSIKSAKKLGDKFANVILYKALYPEKSLFKAYFSRNKNVALDEEISHIDKEIKEMAINRS